MLRHRLERLGDSPWARVALGFCILVAGIILGLMYHRASAVATQQASSVQAVCDQGGPAGIELTYRGTCQQAREVTADPVVGAVGPAGQNGQDGQPGIQGATGAPGRPGSNGVGVPGTPGAAGQDGAPGIPGVAGTNGQDGAPGRNGSDGQNGVTGPPGPTGPAGPAGPEGPPGPTGPQGDPGPAGNDATAAACPTGTTLQPVTFADGKAGMGCVSPSS